MFVASPNEVKQTKEAAASTEEEEEIEENYEIECTQNHEKFTIFDVWRWMWAKK